MDSSIDKDNIKGETNVLTRKRIAGPGIDHINLAMQSTKEDTTEDEKNRKYGWRSDFGTPNYCFLIKHDN